jgi:hypothetical protein
MARPWVADEGDGLQIWKVAANILNKQSRAAHKGLKTSRRKNHLVTKCLLQRASSGGG